MMFYFCKPLAILIPFVFDSNIDIIQTVERVVSNKEASSRLQSAQALGLAAQGYTLADSIYKVASKTPTSGYLIRVESGTGVAHSRQSQESEAHISQGNLLNGKEVILSATGQNSTQTDRTLSTELRENQNQGNTGNIRLEHTDITSRDKDGKRLTNSRIELNADKIEIEAGESRTKEQSRGQNIGVEAGSFAQAGGQTGVGVYATVGGGSQKANGESTTYHNSHLDAEHIQFNSQGDISLKGTTATAERIDVNAKGDLRIESKQDNNSYNSRGSQAGISVDVSFGNAWSVSGFASGERGKSSYKQVNEQAGLFAGDGGYHVEANNTHLNAGAIASTNPNNSELRTNRFTFEDIRNESSHKATSASISGSYGRGEDYYVNKDTGKLSKKGAENATFVEGKTGPSFNSGIPMHSQGSDSSITRATLTEGKITLNKDTTPTQTSANALGINTELNQANSQVEKPKEVKKLLSEQKEIAQAVGHISSAVQTYTANKQAEAEQKVKEAKKALEQAQANPNASSSEIEAKLTALFEATQTQKQWDNDGTYHRTAKVLTTVVTGILANQSAGAIATQSLSPKVNELIKQATTDEQGNVDVLTNTLAHALWGAIESVAANGTASAGAVSAATAELAAPALAKLLYNKTDASQLTAEEGQHIITLSSIAGAVAGGVTSQTNNQSNTTANTVQNAALGGEIGKSAVAYNFLSEPSRREREKILGKYLKGEKISDEEKKRFLELSYFDQRSDELLDKLKSNNPLTKIEEMDLERFYQRYLIEMTMGRSNYGQGDRFEKTMLIEEAEKIFDNTYVKPNVIKIRNYSFPYAGTDAQIDKAMENIPANRRILNIGSWGWGRSQSDWAVDEKIYREFYSELSTRQELPQDWKELAIVIGENYISARGGKRNNSTNFALTLPKQINSSNKFPIIGNTIDYSLGYSSINGQIVKLKGFKGSTQESLDRFNNFLANTVETTTGKGVRNATKPPEIFIESDWAGLTKDAQVREYANGRKVAVFATGEQAVFRPSKTGPMTIELQRPDSKKIIEVRYAQ